MRIYATFQNSMVGLINLYQNFNKGNLTLQFAVASNPKKPNEIQKGDRIYDYENSRWFSLMEEECGLLLSWLSRPKDQIQIKHFPQDCMTVLEMKYTDNRFYLGFVEIRNKQSVFNLKLGLDLGQVYTFKNYLESISMVKTLAAFQEWVQWKSSRANGGSNKQYNNNGYQQNNSNSVPTKPPFLDSSIGFNDNSIPNSTNNSSNSVPNLPTPANPLDFIK